MVVGALVVSYSQEALRTLGVKRLLEVTNVVEFEELREGEALFAEGDPSMVRTSSFECLTIYFLMAPVRATRKGTVTHIL